MIESLERTGTLAYNPFTKKEEHILAKDDLIDVQGTITAVHSGGLYRVQ